MVSRTWLSAISHRILFILSENNGLKIKKTVNLLLVDHSILTKSPLTGLKKFKLNANCINNYENQRRGTYYDWKTSKINEI